MPFLNKEHLERIPLRRNFSDEYKKQIFILWYNSGKPSPGDLKLFIKEPDPLTNRFFTESQLKHLINSEFRALADYFDNEVAKALETKLVSEKVEMLREHAELGKNIAKMGMDYLEEHGIGGSRNALNAIIQGLKIERESRGTPIELAKIAKMSDDQIIEELKDLVEGSEILSLEAYNSEDVDEEMPDM